MRIPNDDRPTFDLGPVSFLGGAAPSRGSSTTSLWTLTIGPGITDGLPHRLDHEEVFLVVDGEPMLTLADVAHRCGPGDVVIVPPGTPLTLTNPGSAAATLVASIPSGFRATAEDGTEIGTPPWAT